MKTLAPSATVTINALASKKKRNGERVHNFSAGDPVLGNHPSIINKAIKETEKKFFPYPPVEGLPELRSLAAAWVNSSCGTSFTKENVLVTCGGKFALFASIYALLQANDEVLIPAPYWVSFPDIVKMAGGIPIPVLSDSANGWKVTPQDLLKHISAKTKMLIFNNACNPTGVLYTKEEVKEILEFAKRHDLMVISDEVYSGLVYDQAEFISCGLFSEHSDRVLIVQSCSKNFGMTGWRVGFILGPEHIIHKLAALQGQSTTGVSTISQWGAVGALENADEVNTYVKNAMENRRNLFFNMYNTLFPAPLEKVSSALYAFVPIKGMGVQQINCSVKFSEELIYKHNIAVVPGTAFGADAHVRVAYSESEEDIHEALLALKKAIECMGGSAL